MVKMTIALITCLFFGASLGSPTNAEVPSTKDILLSVYGPLSTWKTTKLIDAYPGAYVDGKPANSSVILNYSPPEQATAEQHERAEALLASADKARSLAKRDSFRCYRSGKYALQYQLRLSTSEFCNTISSTVVPGKSVVALYERYPDGAGNWAVFANAGGVVTTVVQTFKVNTGFVFSLFHCVNTFWRIANDCHGGYPDSQGGYWTGAYSGLNDARIDPDD